MIISVSRRTDIPAFYSEWFINRVNELPFDSDRKLMTTIHKVDEGYRALTKGAPDVLIERCNSIQIGSEISTMTPQIKDILKSKIENVRRIVDINNKFDIEYLT